MFRVFSRAAERHLMMDQAFILVKGGQCAENVPELMTKFQPNVVQSKCSISNIEIYNSTRLLK